LQTKLDGIDGKFLQEEKYQSIIDNLKNQIKKQIICFSIPSISKENKNGYNILKTIVYEEKNITLLKEVIKICPEIVCSQNEEGKLFFEDLVERYANYIKENELDGYPDLLYYDFAIDEFLKSKEAKFDVISKQLVAFIQRTYNSVLSSKRTKNINQHKILLLKLESKILNNSTIRLNGYAELNQKYGINYEFPDAVCAEIARLKYQPDNYIDLRNLLTFTIDPEDTRDCDDAISIERLPNGNCMVYFHVANPCAYVRLYSTIADEAQKRGETIYLADKTIHMFPKELSCNLFSLMPNVGRDAVTQMFEFDSNMNYINGSYQMFKSIIMSDYNLSYNSAARILKDRSKNGSLYEALKTLYELQFNIGNSNAEKDTYMEIERVIQESEKGNKYDTHKEGFSCYKMVQEFAIQANSRVASLGLPIIYRVHRENSQLASLPILEQIKNNGISKEKYLDLVAKLKRYDYAYYSSENSKHHALGGIDYCHFTSPIRRYSDFYNMWVLMKLYFKYNVRDKDYQYFEKTTPIIARRLNELRIIHENYEMEYHDIREMQLRKRK
jgi:ribonuclease R